MKNRFSLPLLLLLTVAAPLQAGLPVAVDGQPLPSLAPMLEPTSPAVVNIATPGKTRRRIELPLLNDPLFRRFFEVPSVERVLETSSLGSGVIIFSVNKQLARSFDEVFALIEGNGKALIMNIQRGDRELFILLK